MRDYTGKIIYLGIDVHKRTYAVTVICDKEVVKRDTMKARPSGLIAYCEKYFPGAQIKSAYEAGFSGLHLHRSLEAAGIQNIVVHAAGIEVAVGNKVKTDKRDSLRIATQLTDQRLRGIHIPSPEQEDKRAVTRLRETFVRHRTRVACQVKALLFQHGLIGADDKKRVSAKWMTELETLLMPKGVKYAVNQYISLWRDLDKKIKEIEEELKSQAQEDKALEVVYRSVPGIGQTSARILANELGEMSQFKNERQLFSYVGLTPSEHSSGEHVRQGHITRQGKPVLRKILVQAAWKAISLDEDLGKSFSQLEVRTGAKKAIIAIARKLIGRIRACFRVGELYRKKTILQEKKEELFVA